MKFAYPFPAVPNPYIERTAKSTKQASRVADSKRDREEMRWRGQEDRLCCACPVGSGQACE